MSKANYTLSSKVGSDGRSQVLVRFVASKTEAWRGKTGVWIKPDNWDARQGFPRNNRRDQDDIAECRRVQGKLDALSAFLAKKYNEDTTHGGKWLTEALSGLVWGKDGLLNTTLQDFAAMDMAESATLMTDEGEGKAFLKVTARAYRSLAKKMEAYEDRYGKVKVGEFDARHMARLLDFGRDEYGLSDNSVYGMRVNIMRWWHWCRAKDPTLSDMAAASVNVRSKAYGTPYYLTKEQRDKLYEAPMPDMEAEEVRDAFVLQCLIGCRISDMRTLTSANIHGDRIEYIARKTLHSNPQTISVPLHRIAREIIAKYAGREILAPAALLHHQSYDNRLRRAIKASGIDVTVTVRDCHTGEPKQVMLSEVASSHMARRTFVGCLYENGFRESDICSMSGHKEGSLSIQRYRRVSDERKRLMIDSI